ncbi:MAG: aromatic ring-hydroxylating dioxygenase subunit alpha [Alphaproteobacteria bacterium]|nr:aromatic ring-hydroxylating dioxygenase subunit alpha [Alphaproteobacteria bacterium]
MREGRSLRGRTDAAPTGRALAFDRDPLRSATLPARWYFDPAVFAREREAIFFASWQFVGLADEVARNGDFVAATILDQPVFVIRGADGRLRAFYNACPHRGHTLVEGSGQRRSITCPFHAWTFALDGRLKAAGNAGNIAGFRLEDYALREIHVTEFARLVFVNLSPSAAPLGAIAGDLEADIRAKIPAFDRLKFFRRDPFDIGANWKFVFDGLECYHCPHIHPDIMGRDDSPFELSFEFFEARWWSRHVARGNRDVTRNKPENLPYAFAADDAIQDVFVWYLWPNVMLAAHQGPPNFQIRHVMPLSAERSLQHIWNLAVNDPPSATDVANADYLRDVLDPQDIAAMERQQRGVRCRGYTRGRLMCDPQQSWRSEHGTHHFQRLVWQALAGSDR